MAIASRVEWALEPPEDALPRLLYETPTVINPSLVLASAFISLAIGDAWMVPATAHTLPSTLALYFFEMSFWIFLLSRVSRLWTVPRQNFWTWWRAGAFAIAPLHLVLPGALLLRPFGPPGFGVFELLKLLLLYLLMRRWVLAIKLLNGWPSWAATLLVASPFLIGSAAVLMATLLGAGVMGVVALGLLK